MKDMGPIEIHEGEIADQQWSTVVFSNGEKAVKRL